MEKQERNQFAGLFVDLTGRLEDAAILKQVISGAQPMYVTSDFLIKQGVSGRWSRQRDLLAENPVQSDAA